jgi:hypothetical protein
MRRRVVGIALLNLNFGDRYTFIRCTGICCVVCRATVNPVQREEPRYDESALWTLYLVEVGFVADFQG